MKQVSQPVPAAKYTYLQSKKQAEKNPEWQLEAAKNAWSWQDNINELDWLNLKQILKIRRQKFVTFCVTNKDVKS